MPPAAAVPEVTTSAMAARTKAMCSGFTGRSGTAAPEGWLAPPMERMRRGCRAFLPFASRATITQDCRTLMLV